MPTVKEALKLLAWILFVGMLSAAFNVICRLPTIIHSEAEATRAMLAGVAHIAIEDANARLAEALAKADGQLTSVIGEVHLAGVNADRRAADIETTLAQAEVDLNQLGGETNAQMRTFNAVVATSLQPAREIAQQLDDALPLFADCDHNPDCAFNRFQGVSKAFEQTSIVIAKAAPSLVSSADKIAASSVDTSAAVAATGQEVAIAAKRFNAPQTKWQEFRSWLLTLARIYGAI